MFDIANFGIVNSKKKETHFVRAPPRKKSHGGGRPSLRLLSSKFDPSQSRPGLPLYLCAFWVLHSTGNGPHRNTEIDLNELGRNNLTNVLS